PDRADRGGRPADLSVRLEAHTLQPVSVDQRAPRVDRSQEPRLQGRRDLRPRREHLQRGWNPESKGGEVGPGVPNLLALAAADIRALHGGSDPRYLHVVDNQTQRGHWRIAHGDLLYSAGGVLGLLRCVYRACVRIDCSPPQTTHRTREESMRKRGGGLTPAT